MTIASEIAGKTSLSPEVVYTITKMSVLAVDGVHSFAKVPTTIENLFKTAGFEGIRLNVEDGLVYLDLFINLNADQNVREISRHVQLAVSRAISELAGMEVGQVNIHIENIIYESRQ